MFWCFGVIVWFNIAEMFWMLLSDSLGAYGTVYRGRDLTDQGKLVALKKIRISLTEDGIPVNAVREIALLKNLDNFRHPNIVR